MRHANPEDLDRVMEIFKQYNKWFPHVRRFHINNRINWGRCILDNDVVITYGGSRSEGPQYNSKRKVGDFQIYKGDVILHQIAKDKNGTGIASDVLQRFFKYVNTNVVLSVRSDNVVANKFYKKNGMKDEGKIEWGKDGYLKGKVWYYRNKSKLYK